MYSNEKTEKKHSNIQNPASKFSAFCFDWLETLVHCGILTVILFVFFFRVAKVEMESMENTLFEGDRLVVTYWNYTPQRGDIIVMKRGKNFDKPIVKRIIALGGDTLDMNFETGAVTLNGKVLDEQYIKEKMWLRGDVQFPMVIPKDELFVMGDNRNRSADSRMDVVGLIPKENVVGKAVFILFPFNRFGAIKSPVY